MPFCFLRRKEELVWFYGLLWGLVILGAALVIGGLTALGIIVYVAFQ